MENLFPVADFSLNWYRIGKIFNGKETDKIQSSLNKISDNKQPMLDVVVLLALFQPMQFDDNFVS